MYFSHITLAVAYSINEMKTKQEIIFFSMGMLYNKLCY